MAHSGDYLSHFVAYTKTSFDGNVGAVGAVLIRQANGEFPEHIFMQRAATSASIGAMEPLSPVF
jgi:hypothetical protein